MTNIRYDRFHKRITHNQTYIVVLETISSYIVEYFFFSIKHKECLFLRTLLKLCLGEPDRWLSTVASLTENILYTSHLVVPSVNIYWRWCFEQPQCRRLFISSKLPKGRHADRTNAIDQSKREEDSSADCTHSFSKYFLLFLLCFFLLYNMFFLSSMDQIALRELH